MKYLIIGIFLLASSSALAQSSYHTIRTSDSIFTVSTSCIGSYCSSTISSRPIATPGTTIPIKEYRRRIKERCVEPKLAFGENLERYTEPMDSKLAFCIKDEAIRRWVIDSNYQKYLQGNPLPLQTTMHPAPANPAP